MTFNRCAWLAMALAAWFALLPRVPESILCLLFVLTVIAPLWWLCSVWLCRRGLGGELSVVTGGALAWIVLAIAYELRKWLGFPEWRLDAGVVAMLAVAASVMWRRKAATDGRLVFLDRSDLFWILVAIPLLFVLPRLGNEVRVGAEVRYYGLMLVDFGNLRSVVNLLTASATLPLNAVEGTGPLSYHWFFFAVPAWMGSFLGSRLESSGPLTICTFIVAALFFKTLSRACAVALKSTGRAGSDWCAWGAGLGIFALSTSYIYLVAVNAFGGTWLTQGERNHLLLQLPNSINVFGNNTFALTLALVALLALMAWNETGKPVLLAAAAVATAWIPGFSVTLAPAMALGIGAACLFGLIRSPWVVATAFASAALCTLAIMWALNLFSARAEVLVVSFDGGQFVQNVVLAFAPAILALCWCWLSARDLMTRLVACIVAGALAVPTFLVLKGGHAGAAALSMKTGSLVLALCAPMFTVLVHDWWTGTGDARLKRWALVLLVGAGLANAVAYVTSNPFARLRDRNASGVMAAEHFDALTHVRRTTPDAALIIDPLGLDERNAEPAVLVAARRVVLVNAYSRMGEIRNDKTDERMGQWKRWEASGLRDEELSQLFALLADRMLVRSELTSQYWMLDAQFGAVRVYRSMLRDK